LNKLAHLLLSMPTLEAAPLARELVPILTGPTGLSSAGYPYLDSASFRRFRDTIPHILSAGDVVWEACEHVAELVDTLDATEVAADEREGFERAIRVVRSMANTAAVTAPPDLWLLRHVLGTYKTLGLTDRLLAGEVLDPTDCVPTLWLDDDELAAELARLSGLTGFDNDQDLAVHHARLHAAQYDFEQAVDRLSGCESAAAVRMRAMAQGALSSQLEDALATYRLWLKPKGKGRIHDEMRFQETVLDADLHYALHRDKPNGYADLLTERCKPFETRHLYVPELCEVDAGARKHRQEALREISEPLQSELADGGAEPLARRHPQPWLDCGRALLLQDQQADALDAYLMAHQLGLSQAHRRQVQRTCRRLDEARPIAELSQLFDSFNRRTGVQSAVIVAGAFEDAPPSVPQGIARAVRDAMKVVSVKKDDFLTTSRSPTEPLGHRGVIAQWRALLGDDVDPRKTLVIAARKGPITNFQLRLAWSLGARIVLLRDVRIARKQFRAPPHVKTAAVVELAADEDLLVALLERDRWRSEARERAALTEPQWWEFAQRIHEGFCKLTARAWGTPVAREPWSKLKETYRQENYDAALGIVSHVMRLKAKRKSVDALTIAKMESDRWVVNRALAGWRYRSPRRNSELEHPLLNPWSVVKEDKGTVEYNTLFAEALLAALKKTAPELL